MTNDEELTIVVKTSNLNAMQSEMLSSSSSRNDKSSIPLGRSSCVKKLNKTA